MALSGEIASLFVRLRPDLHSFKTETVAGVKGVLSDVQAEVAATARANIAHTKEELQANRQLAASYKQIASAAVRGSDEQKIAASAAAAATEKANLAVASSSRAAKRETEGLKSRLLGVAQIAGLAFGAGYAFEFVKHITESAASVQKSVEVIRANFGRAASEVVVKFGDTAAAALGISAEAANATSARFGILFRNLGIGPGVAAAMTVNLEKLAGSLSVIRGIDPSRALQQITLAMLGNVRSLKQLGLSVDVPTEKIAAFKLGLISSTKEALTPAIRAQAIYALATAHLGEFQKQAALHSGDLANQQLRLRAEWANAKDLLGTALIPTLTKLDTGIANYLDHALKTGELQRSINRYMRDFGDAIDAVKTVLTPVVGTIRDLVDALGGVGNAVKVMLAAFAISKIAGVANAIRVGLVERGILAIGPAAVTAQAETTVAFAGIGLSAEALSVTIKAALISTGIGALAVAAGIAAVEIIQHWDTVKRWIAGFGEWIKGHAALLLTLPFIGEVAFMAVEVIKHWAAIRAFVTRFAHDLTLLFTHPLAAIRDMFHATVALLRDLFGGFWLWLKRKALEAALAVVEPFSHLPSFLGGWARDAKNAIKGELADLSAVGSSAGDSFGRAYSRRAKQWIDGVAGDANAQTRKNYAATAESVGAAARESPQRAAAPLGAAKGAADEAKRTAAAAKAAVHDAVGALFDELARGKISMAEFHRKFVDALAGLGIGQAAADAIFNADVRDKIGAAKAKLAETIATGNAKIRDAQQRLAEYIRAGQQRIADLLTQRQQKIADMISESNRKVEQAAVAAAANLHKIGKTLTDAIGKFFESGSSTKALKDSPLGQQFKQLRDLIASGKGGPELINAAQELSSQLQAQQAKMGDTTKKKAAAAKHVDDLVDELNRGEITVKQFHHRVLAYLASLGVSYSKIGKSLGKSQGDAYLAELKALFKQAGIIVAEPDKLRDKVKKGGAGQAPKIIDPNTLRASEDEKLARTRARLDRQIAEARSRMDAHIAEARRSELREEQRLNKQILHDRTQITKAVAKAEADVAKEAKTAALVKTVKVNPIVDIADAHRKGHRVGKSMADGAVQGVLDSSAKLKDAGTFMSDTIESGARTKAKAHSPSRLFLELGVDIVRGIAKGIADSRDADKAASDVVSRMLHAARGKAPAQSVIKQTVRLDRHVETRGDLAPFLARARAAVPRELAGRTVRQLVTLERALRQRGAVHDLLARASAPPPPPPALTVRQRVSLVRAISTRGDLPGFLARAQLVPPELRPRTVRQPVVLDRILRERGVLAVALHTAESKVPARARTATVHQRVDLIRALIARGDVGAFLARAVHSVPARLASRSVRQEIVLHRVVRGGHLALPPIPRLLDEHLRAATPAPAEPGAHRRRDGALHGKMRIEAERHAELLSEHRSHRKVLKENVAGQKKVIEVGRRTARAALNTSVSNAAIAATTVNTSGFPSTTTKNPGVTADRARAGSMGGLR